jgi:hypothetical protein
MDDVLADDLRNHRTDTRPDRSDVLLDEAQDHLRNQAPERAEAIWQNLIAEGGEGSDGALAEYADYVVRHLHHEVEQSVLQAAIAKSGTNILTELWAAALLERRGQLVDALIRYSQATDDLTAEQVSSSRLAKLMVTGRRRVKWALGIELDSIDRLGEVGDVEAAETYFDLLDLLRAPTIFRGRVQVWSRDELAGACEHWPERITPVSIVTYYRGVEKVLREYDERVIVVHRNFQFFTDCVDALERLTFESGGGELRDEPPPDETSGVPWPPERNQPCWCGSENKYKKCCGVGGATSDPLYAWGPAGLRAGAQLAVCRV